MSSSDPAIDAVYGAETKPLRRLHVVAWSSVAAMVVTVAVVVWAWIARDVTPLYVTAALWATIPPMWFWYEHFYMYRAYGLAEGFELFKHGQQVSAAIWAGVTLTIAGLASSDHFKPPAAATAAVAKTGAASSVTPPADSVWDDVSNIAQTAAIVGAALWFGVQWFVRRQLDAAIVLDVEVNVFPTHGDSSRCTVELAVVAKNATAVGAGIEKINFTVKPVVGDAFPPQSGSWLPNVRETLILTRDTAWRLVSTLDMPTGQLAQIEAECKIAMQPAKQTVRFARVFSTAIDWPAVIGK